MNDIIKLAYFSGIKIGIQSLIEQLQEVANKDKDLLTIELITMLASGCTSYATLKIQELDCGNEAIEMLSFLKQ